MNISMKQLYQYMPIYFNFSPTASHLHPPQVENCDSNSRLVVDEDDNGKVRLERVKTTRNHFLYAWLLAIVVKMVNLENVVLSRILYIMSVSRRGEARSRDPIIPYSIQWFFILSYKTKMQYRLTLQARRYCLSVYGIVLYPVSMTLANT